MLMDKTAIDQHIDMLIEKSSKLASDLSFLKVSNYVNYPGDYEMITLANCLKAESIACDTRELIYTATGLCGRISKLKHIADNNGIDINFISELDAISINLPSLIPKRTPVKKGAFLLDTLRVALENYLEANYHEKYSNATICFIHSYNANIARRSICDYDNIETKQVLDIISTYLLTDDTSLLCDEFNTTIAAERAYTQILIMPKNKFQRWFNRALR